MTDPAGQSSGFAMPGVDQIGIVVHNCDEAVEMLSSVFGIGPWDVKDVEFTGVEVRGEPTSLKARIGFAQAGAVQIEVIQPLEGRSIYDEHLETKGDGLHHLGFLVPDMDERVAEMARRGVGVLQAGHTGRKSGFAYLDTAKSAGVILEFISASSGILRYFESVKQMGKKPQT